MICILSLHVTAHAEVSSHQWSSGFGDEFTQVARSVAVDHAGNVIVTGWMHGTIDFGGGSLTAAGDDIFLAKFDPNGNHLWSHHFSPSVMGITYPSVAVDHFGNIVLVGWFFGAVDFGGGLLTAPGDRSDVFVAKFTPGGGHWWSHNYGDSNTQMCRDVAVDGEGNIVITGSVYGAMDFGGGPLTSAGSSSVFVAKLDLFGNHVWSDCYGDSDNQSPNAVCIDSTGNIAVTGYFDGTLDFKGNVLTSAGDFDVFLVVMDGDGDHVWSGGFGNALEQWGHTVVFDHSGNVLITGYFRGTLDFGGMPLSGSYDMFLAKFDPDGNHVWSDSYGGSGVSVGWGVAVDRAGFVSVTGHYNGTVDFGGGPLQGSGGRFSAFLAKYESDGDHVYSESFGDHNDQTSYDIALDDMGRVTIVGSFEGQVNFGGGTIVSAGESNYADVFVAQFDLEYVPTRLHDYSVSYDIRANGIALEWCLAEADDVVEFLVLRGNETTDRLSELRTPEITEYESSYSFIDRSVEPGSVYRYRVDVLDDDGRKVLFETQEVAVPATVLSLDQNYPNPFNPQTTLTYSVPQAGKVLLEVYNTRGRLVRTLVNELKPAGVHSAIWAGKDNNGMAAATGIYFVRLESGHRIQTRKVTLLK